MGRYQAIESELKSINASPNIAWKIISHWCVGVGVSINYTEVELNSALDFVTICVAAMNVIGRSLILA